MKKSYFSCLLTTFFSLLICVEAVAGTWTSGSTTVTTSGSTLTVSGNGAMEDYDFEFNTPWLTSSITSIVIEEGVTHIGAYAFIGDYYNPSNVTSVTIPTSVTSIGEDAFASNLKMANIYYAGSPNEWASITFGNDASNPFGDTEVAVSDRKVYFHGCNFTTTTLTLSPGLTRVNDYAFYKMRIVNLNIPGSVAYIGRWAFKCDISGQVCVNRTTPPTTGNQALNYTTAAKLYVPAGSESTYTSAGKPWYRSSYGNSDGASSVNGQAVSGTLSAEYGSGVTWALDEDGVLTFDASSPSASKSITLGAGQNYPWGLFRRLVDKVRLRGEITALGDALAYHWFLSGVVLDQNTVPTCSNNIGSSSLSGTTSYNSLFNPCHPLTINIHLSTLRDPDEQAKIESAPWNDGHWQVSLSDDIVINENSTDNMELLNLVRTYVGAPFTMRLVRSVSNAYYNTFCSPIDLTAEQVEATFGAGTLIHALNSTSYDLDANELTLEFADSQNFMDAGVPYLFWPANSVVNPTFTDVEPTSVAASEGVVDADHVVFHGTIEPRAVSASEIAAQNFIFLQADNYLNWANAGTLKGMRAYWLLKNGVPARALERRPQMQIGRKTPTGVEKVQSDNVQSTKVLRDGQLIIIRDGKEYNVMGIRL